MIRLEWVWRLVAIGSLVCIGCAASPSRLSSPAQGGSKWTRVDTANFRVFTDLEPEEARHVALQLERDLDALGQAAFESVRPVVEHTDVVIFAEREDYHHFAHQSTDGVFYTALPLDPESPHTVVTFGGINRRTRTILLHELTHDLFARNFGAAPTWLNEGWAEYYSTVRVVDGQVQIGAPLPGLTLTTDRDPFVAQLEGREVVAIPIASLPAPSELMAMSSQDFYRLSTDDDPAHEETLRQAAHYLGAWAFVHMLLDGKNPYAERFKVFQRDALDSSVQDAWSRAFAGVTAKQLDDYFRAYLATAKLSIFGLAYKDNVVNQAEVHPMTDGAVHLLWANLYTARLGDMKEANTHAKMEVEDALKAAPELAEAHHLRGLLALHEGRLDVAATALARAAELSPNEPRFLWSQLRLEFIRRQGRLQPSELNALLPKFERLASLAKSSQQLLIAAVYHQARGNSEQALTLAQRAVKLDPIDPLVLDNYATVLEGAGLWKDALEVQRRALAFVSDGEQEQRKALREHLEALEARTK